jgi:hypothetical protein
VTRRRRPGAGEILLVYMLLATIGFIWDWQLSRQVPVRFRRKILVRVDGAGASHYL